MCTRLAIFGGLVVSACGDSPALPGVDAASSPDAAVLPDAAVPDAAVPDAGPFCGDGVRQDGEGCDRQDFAGRTCADEGYYGGQLACRPECKVEASGCAGRCGDGEINGPELCDDALPLAGTCRSRGFLVGTPACVAGCALVGCQNIASSRDEIILWGRDDTSRLGASMAFAGDVDGDGREELLAAAPGEARVLGKKGAVYLIPGSHDGRATINNAARFVDDSWIDVSSLELAVAAARDLDGDGRADFLIAAMTGAGHLDVYLIYGHAEPFTGTLNLAALVDNGMAARFSIPSARLARRPALGVPDVTGDGRSDLVLAIPAYDDGRGAAYVIPGDAVRYSGTLALPPPVAPLPRPVRAALVGSSASSALGNDLAVGDLDGDSVADLFMTSGGDVQVVYGPIAGVRSLADAEVHTELGPVTSLAVADLDGDRAAELVVTTDHGGFLFRGGSSRRAGALGSSDADVSLSTWPTSMVRVGGDVDGDGHPELIVTRLAFFADIGIVAGPIAQRDFLLFDEHSVRWRLNVAAASTDPLDVALGDFNGDGFADVAVATVAESFGSKHGVVQIVHGATSPRP